MARKKFFMKSKTTPIIIALAIPIVSVALAIALIYFKKRNVSGLDEFPYAAYSASPDSLSGNRYVLEAQMDVQLANVEGGRVVAALGGREGFPVALLAPRESGTRSATGKPWARTYPPSSATRW